MKIVIRRIYDQPRPDDGYRVLVDRLWPRGVAKATAELDEWAKEVAPSTDLRVWFHEDREGRWEKFGERYRQELTGGDDLGEFTERLRAHDRVTFLIAAADTRRTHADVLRGAVEDLMATGKS